MKRRYSNIGAVIVALYLIIAVTPTASATELEDAVAAADADAGGALFRRCLACHTDTEDGANRVGPNLWGVLGRQFGLVQGFRYSRALAGSEEFWTLENLDAFIENPRSARPGTSMSYPGVRNEQDRLSVLAYLASLQSEPDNGSDETGEE